MQSGPDEQIRLALAHVCSAIEAYEASASDAYADAAFNARLSNYGNLCAKRILLQRVRSDLSLLARSVHRANLLLDSSG